MKVSIFFLTLFSATLFADPCEPRCSWLCDDPVCPAECSIQCPSPLCPSPQCPDPDCTCASFEEARLSFCPGPLESACPTCTAKIKGQNCHNSEGERCSCNATCSVNGCFWQCQSPQYCPEPRCELQCEQPVCEGGKTF